jgi:hypothetical protein
MNRHALLVLPAALLCLAAAPAAKPPAKPAPAKTAPAKAVPAKPATTTPPAGPFDSQNPQGLMELLGEAGAKVQTNRREEDSVFVTVASAAANFSLQFAGCSPQGRGCQAALFDGLLEGTSPTLVQMNGFNQTSVVCRLYQDRTSKAHATYAALLLRSDTRDSARTHLAAWQGCLAEARDFVRDPVAYLANAA